MYVADVPIRLILNKGPTTKCEHPFYTIYTRTLSYYRTNAERYMTQRTCITAYLLKQ